VADTQYRSQYDRDPVLFGDLVAPMDHLPRLFRCRGVQQGDPGCHGQQTCVLLSLGTVRAWIVGNYNKHPTDDTCVGKTHERVQGNIQAHLFHDHSAFQSGKGGGCAHLKSNLLVHRPFDMKAIGPIGNQRFQNLCRRSPRISGGHPASGFVKPLSYGFISQEEAVTASSRENIWFVRGQSPSLRLSPGPSRVNPRSNRCGLRVTC